MRFDIVINPAGASGKAWRLWQELEPVFKDSGSDYRIWRSTRTRSITEICSQISSREGVKNIVVIGGDGTANEAVNGITDFHGTRFAFIPCGTGNDFGRDMGLPKKRSDLARRILEGEIMRTCDIGETTFYGRNGTIVRRFNISSDIGFGAATCAYADSSRIKPVLNKLGLGRLIYLIEALKVCFTAKPASVRLTYQDGTTESYEKCLCVIGMNHGYEGGGFRFCPHADFDDGQLDLCIGDGLSKPAFIRMLPYAYKGTHLKLKGIYEKRCAALEVCSAQPLWVHTDGEVLGKASRVEMRIMEEKLNLLI